MSPGVEKALAFPQFSNARPAPEAALSQPQLAGVQRLIMDATLPCTIFKALCAVSLDVELLRWPLLGVVFVCVQLAAASVASKRLFPDAVKKTNNPLPARDGGARFERFRFCGTVGADSVPVPQFSELQLCEDGVSTISRHRDAVDEAVS